MAAAVPMKTDERRVRFWLLYVDYGGTGCWEFKGSQFSNGSGYGQYAYDGRNRRVHGLVWEWLFGYAPLVMHKCNNKLCVRPSHLKVGTQSQNVCEALEAGLKIHFRNQAKLADADVLVIRRLHCEGVRNVDITMLYPFVDRSTISHVVRGHTFRHLL